jgi:hypothetical protein
VLIIHDCVLTTWQQAGCPLFAMIHFMCCSEIADVNVVKVGDLVVVVSDIITGEDTVRSLQVRNIL